MALIEFYLGNARHPFAHVDDGGVPRQYDAVNIKGVSYQVERVTWALDQADKYPPEKKFRANVELKEL